jgi:hypothetical protein
MIERVKRPAANSGEEGVVGGPTLCQVVDRGRRDFYSTATRLAMAAPKRTIRSLRLV